MVMAVFSSIQYGVLVDLEYYGIINPFGVGGRPVAMDHAWSHVFFKVAIIMWACFAVAFLSGLLAEHPAEIREMFALRFGQVLSYREIAACLGLSESAVKQRFSRTLRELRKKARSCEAEQGEVDYAI